MSNDAPQDRRDFLRTAALTVATARFGVVGSAGHPAIEAQYDPLEQKLFATPVITVPAITIASDFDGPAASGQAYARLYSGKYSHRVLNGIGHNVPQEAPQASAAAIVEVDGY